MNTSKYVGGVAVATVIFMTGPAAFAEVTSQQVWDDWKTYMSDFGYDMQSTESANSAGLTVSDITMGIQIPDEDVTINISMGDLNFVDNGDGTVSVKIPAVMPIVISGEGDDGAGSATINYTTTGFNMTVSGDVSDMTYTYSAASVGVALAEIVAKGTPVDIGTAALEMTRVSGSTNMKVGNIRTSTQQVISGPVTYNVDIKDPDSSNGRFVLNGGTESLNMQALVAIPGGLDMTDMVAALAAGFAVEGAYDFGPSNVNFNFTDRGDTVQGKSQSDGGGLSLALDEGGLAYAGSTSNMAMEFAGGDIPFPISLAMGEGGFELLMPVSADDEAQDFSLGILLGDFTMSDFIWGIFDPSGQLPRDPATVALDVSGLVTLFANVMDPAAMESSDVPGEVNAVTVHELVVSAAGAELTGQGDFEFDNSDLTSFDGIPKPVGAIDLALVGANGLMDKLVAMGLLPEEQAMGARMMMGMFAVPGDGEDSLKSKIEFTEEGYVLANGQRLK